MRTQLDETNSIEVSRYRKILWFLVFLLIVPFSLFLTLGNDFYAILTASLILLIVVFLMLSSKKYYNWTLPFIGVFFLGLFFKMNHLAGASLMITTSCLMVFFNLLFFSVKSFFVLRHNMFLKWFSFFTGIALALFMYAFMSKVQHWPLFMEFWILRNIINLLLVLLTLVIIFKLPGLNFASWSQLDRKVFYRQILLPLVIIFSFNITILISPTFFESIFYRGWQSIPWGMYSVPLKQLEGLSLTLPFYL